jgi:hypothetical protein
MPRSVSAALLLSVAVSSVAHGSPLRGTLQFPPPPRAADARPLAYWRIENGVVPIAQPQPESRRDVVVVLQPEKSLPPRPEGQSPEPVVIEAKPLRLEPRVAIGEAGARLVIRNADRMPRTVYLDKGESFVPKEQTAPGAERSVKFTVVAEYTLLDVDNPRAVATLLVVPSPFFARADDRGGFVIDAPDGKYNLRAYYRGAWTDSQPVEVGGHARDVTVRLPSRSTSAAPTGDLPPPRSGGPAAGEEHGAADAQGRK